MIVRIVDGNNRNINMIGLNHKEIKLTRKNTKGDYMQGGGRMKN